MGDASYQRWKRLLLKQTRQPAFTAELQRRLTAAEASTLAVAAHPGGSRTDLATQGLGLSNRAMAVVVPLVTQPVAKGALPMLRAATAHDVTARQFYGPRVLTAETPVLETRSTRARSVDDAALLWELSATAGPSGQHVGAGCG